MPKRSSAIDQLPAVVQVHLSELGENLAIARKRRRESMKDWAQRIGVSEPTLARMERGDPSVAMGVYATALWLIARDAQLPTLAAPEHDLGALEEAVRAALRRSVRKKMTIEERLAGLASPSPAAGDKP
ncbi:helix-turn-helix domain-containing protein [Roseateles amylovorans]|jgi:transcriptional regulator with XRE-family HTH domain|uniref:Helix-turn-helix domain-containing protein n=1 Tax=Roseateles amylovorans TaxID=2978473 RepID=A0ABY6B075_9BURK|nr:helix-turn-helix transcriptional regulator [Roseateles amylovorans]UXH78794.1 helix-turn-helix domain-containing protein [Roseateles amylovorans]